MTDWSTSLTARAWARCALRMSPEQGFDVLLHRQEQRTWRHILRRIEARARREWR